MTSKDRWLLPEGVEEISPQQAWWIEERRSDVLKLLRSRDYDLVLPPMFEYLDALLTGTGQDLELETFTVTDQFTGRLMGIRADMTPQVARIDAHVLRADGPSRLCYAGPVLRTRPRTVGGSREPLQIGAELFGEPGPGSDGEIIQLMVEMAQIAGLDEAPSYLQLDLGHVGVFRSLVEACGADPELESVLFEALVRRSGPDIHDAASSAGLPQSDIEALSALIDLSGPREIVDEARSVFAAYPAVLEAIENLDQVLRLCEQHCPGIRVHIDFAELRGYRYHTGVVFALYVPGHGQAVAQGGRYDDIGIGFGRRRPATGFSADLREIMRIRRARGAFTE